MDVRILIINYFLEVIRYSIGLEIFFGTKVKKWRTAIIAGIFFALCLMRAGNNSLILMYIFAYMTVYGMAEGRGGEKIFRMLVLVCLLGSLDEIVGMTIRHWIGEYMYISFWKAITGLIFLIFLKKIQKRNTKIGSQIFGFIEKKIMIIVLSMIVILSAVITGFYYAEEYVSKVNYQLLVYFISLFAFISMIALVLFIAYIKKSNEALRERVEIEQSLKLMQEKYYKELLEREEDTRRYRHDMQNHLLSLTQYLKKKETDEGLQYIKGLQDTLITIQKSCYVTGNSMLDMFLNHYFLPLKNVKISIWGRCSEDLLIGDVDFCIIFSNLIQNAAEAVERQEKGDKYIRVNMKQRLEYCEIAIQNSVDFQMDSVIQTSKHDKKNHGIGLKNVAEAVRRNNGDFQWGIKDGAYLATVILKRQESKV